MAGNRLEGPEGKSPSQPPVQDDRTRNPFRSRRYAEGDRARHLVEMRKNLFITSSTQVAYEKKIKDHPELAGPANCFNLSYGDPASYGLDAYAGVARFMRRFINFEKPSAYSKYEFTGDPLLVEQLRLGTTGRDKDYVTVPAHVAVFMAPGVAGSLRMMCPAILLPYRHREEQDNVIVPKWTYLSHMAEAALAQAEVRCCNLEKDGQIDLNHMATLMDPNTRAVILSTVGNPLATAIGHDRYDDMLRLIYSKMIEFDHPISVIADVIYEHFRRPSNGERLDAVQKHLKLGLREGVDVPVWETSSFSKMFAMAAQRFGYFRFLRTCHSDPTKPKFAEELDDMLEAINIIYGTTLNPVPSIIQKPIGKMYYSIRAGLPEEESLAPLAAVLASLRELTDMEGTGDTHTMVSEAVVRDMIQSLGIDPNTWFTTSAIAKRLRKLAKDELGGYKVDTTTKSVEAIGQKLQAAGFIKVKTVDVSIEKMKALGLAAAAKHCGAEQNVLASLQQAVQAFNLKISKENVQLLAGGVFNGLTTPSEPIETEETAAGMVRHTFYRLTCSLPVPSLERRENGQLKLYGISERPEWSRFATEFNKLLPGDKKHLGIPMESHLYESFKQERRQLIWSRTDAFVCGIEQMRKEGLGIYLHPSYYDENGKLVPERVNSFYVLFGFDALRKPGISQAAELVNLCVANRVNDRMKIIKATPGEVFLSPECKDEDSSYIRGVTLLPTEKETEVPEDQRVERMLEILRVVAMSLRSRSEMPSPPASGQ